MRKSQFWLLNAVSAVLVVLLIGHFLLSRSNNALNAEFSRQQQYINNARQVQPVLDQLAKRIARGSEVDPRLRNILIKFGLTVTLDTVDGQKKTYP